MTDSINDRSELPLGWVWARHSDIAAVNVKPDFSDFDDATMVSFLPMAAVEERTGRFGLDQVRQFGQVKRGYTPFIDGDLIFAKITPCMENGKIAILYGLTNGIGFGSTEFHTSRFYGEISTKFYFYYFLQETFRRAARREMTGSAGQLRVPSSFFRDVVLPLPPLPEQHRIVAKIEELFSDLDASVAALAQAQAHLRIYRQAVLKYAFDGRLTERWREQHAPPPASELLAQIQAEREQRYRQQLAEWKADVHRWEAAGKVARKPAKPRQPEEVAPLSAGEMEELGELPEGWVWARVAELGEVVTGATPLKKRTNYYEGGTIPWVTSTALNSEYVRRANDFITELALQETNVKVLPKHTLLVAMYGEGKTRGKCSELLIDAATNQAIAGIVQQGTEENTRPYLKHFFFRNYQDIRQQSSGGVQPNLTLNIVKTTILPLCSLAEQQAIVAEIEARLSVVDKLEETLAAALRQAEALRQSILRRAFAGKLIPQDPSDEPAQRLLERIRKARQDQLL